MTSVTKIVRAMVQVCAINHVYTMPHGHVCFMMHSLTIFQAALTCVSGKVLQM